MNMIILEQPYVSDFLIDTIKKNNFKVLDNEIARERLSREFLTDGKNAQLIYTNSENSIGWTKKNYKDAPINKMIELSKDKAAFRSCLKEIYPDYYFQKVTLDELNKINAHELKFPLILKPNTGFLSFGVYTIKNETQWQNVVSNIKNDIKKFENVFPECVVDTTSFIIEEMIEGREFALDAYFNNNGEAVILNIFEHPFFDEDDVSDRVYFSSKEILVNYLDKFKSLLDKIGAAGNYKNFPFHLELRAGEEKIIPIELNPMRFCGWCITDIAYFSWGINVYEYFLNQKAPNWDEIIKNAPDDIFYFTIGDIPSNIKKEEIKEIDYDNYLKLISNPLEIRKIDYKTKPVFAIVFARTNNLDEIKNILKQDMSQFIK